MKPYNDNSFEISDELLIDAYNKAIQSRLDKAFIKLLKEEIERRKKNNDKKEQ
ncbi:sporulation histidine kinase inhibitor Sda [Pseudogracilibacillus sp. SO30301A]|uniref:sporulation histidine kinase inhibitor Sda n=1 Tax=Pseudogracilibacillus sp. SO30301A TaxID=3098291 RepID=UPI00300E14AD